MNAVDLETIMSKSQIEQIIPFLDETPLILTKHFRDRMIERKVTLNEIYVSVNEAQIFRANNRRYAFVDFDYRRMILFNISNKGLILATVLTSKEFKSEVLTRIGVVSPFRRSYLSGYLT